MRDTCLHILCLLLLCSFVSAGQLPADPLNRPVNLHLKNIKKAELLDSIERAQGVFFSYNPELIGARDIVSIEASEKPLSLLLNEIIDREKIGFSSFGNQIVFYAVSEPNAPPADTLRHIIIKGIVFDERKSEPLPYCNIAVMGSTVGTMSNLDGKFSLKIPESFHSDTLRFSCIGYHTYSLPIAQIANTDTEIVLKRQTIQLKTIDVIHYNPHQVLDSFFYRIKYNYEDRYVLFTTYYREVIKQNNAYTDVSEAILEVMKSPYDNLYLNDHVKFVKGRKSSSVAPFSDVKLKLKGGPYYITQLDVVKVQGSFFDPEYRYLYKYSFQKSVLLNDRETIVIEFQPLTTMRDILYKGKFFIDRKTWALSRIEFEFTKEGLREARNMLIEKEPRKMKAIPTELSYIVEYQEMNGKWYFRSARSEFEIKINDRQKKQRTRFNSISEILTTHIEKGDLQQFSRRDIFKPNEFITEKIDSIDFNFWKNYNVIEPEEDLVNALKGFENYNMVIKQINKTTY